MQEMKHVRGKFGYKYNEGEEVCTFPASFAFSKDSSITEELLIAWMKDHLSSLYPGVRDVPGKQVLIKGDCGPGQFSEKFK